MKKKKILFIIWSFSYGGGAEKILANIVNNLNYEKYDIEILEYLHADKIETVNDRVKVLPPIIDITKKDIYSQVYNKLIDKILIKLCPRIIRKIHLNNTYDVEISFNYLIPTFLLNHNSKKLIAWMHSSIYDLDEKIWIKKKQKKALQPVDKIVAISKATKQSILKEFPEYKFKTIKIYNGYDFSKMNADEKENIENFQLLYCNRFDKNKNPQRFVRTIRILRNKGLYVTARMLGTGELFDETIKLIKEYDLESQIKCIGFKKNPYQYYKHSKVFCLTSHIEGFPTTLIESMYFGKPFVTTAVAGTEELSQNCCCGFVEDDENIYAERLVQLLTDAELYEKMSINCKNYVVNYSLVNQIQAIEKNCL